MSEPVYYNASPSLQPGAPKPAGPGGSVYDYQKGRWVDSNTGDVVSTPQNSYYTLDQSGNPVVTSDANLFDEYNQSRGQSMQALQRAMSIGPGGRGMSQSELSTIKNAIGFNDTPTAPNTGPTAMQEQAARASAFARAKDTAGAIARSSLTALRNQLNTRGMLGTDYETGKAADVIGGAANSVGEENNAQLQADLENARHTADRSYQFEDAVAARKSASMNSLLSLIASRGGLY